MPRAVRKGWGWGGNRGRATAPPHPRFIGDVGQARQPSRCPMAQAAAPVRGQRLSWRSQVTCFLSRGAASASFSGSPSTLYFRGINVSLWLACWYTKLMGNLRSLYSWLSSSGGGEEGERKATPLPSHWPELPASRMPPCSPLCLHEPSTVAGWGGYRLSREGPHPEGHPLLCANASETGEFK